MVALLDDRAMENADKRICLQSALALNSLFKEKEFLPPNMYFTLVLYLSEASPLA